MATAVEVKDEFDELLTCSICLEIFRDPKYLPCLHTFCQACINTHIMSTCTPEKGSTGFSCPVCRKFMTMGENSGHPQKWAEQLPKNHLIISLIDKKAITRSEKLCKACELSSVKQKAVSWCCVCQEAFCNACDNCHRKFKVSSNHKMISLQDFTSTESYSQMCGFNLCEEHKDKTIDVYCVDHCKPCCSVCATVNHRRCETVIAIGKAASGIKQSRQTIELVEHFEQLSVKIDEYVQNNKENSSNCDEETRKILQNTGALKKTFIDHINEIEQTLKDDLSVKKKEVMLQLDDEANQLSSLKCTVGNLRRILDTCIKHGSDLQCLIEVNKLISKKTELNSEISSVTSKIKTRSIQFQPDHVMVDIQKTVASFGRIRVAETNFGSPLNLPNIDFHTGNIKIMYTVDVNNGIMEYNAVSGVFLEELIVLTDYGHFRIVTYNHDGVYQSELKLPKQSIGISEIGQSEVAVPAYQSNEIYIINITEMVLKKTIQTTVQPRGLRYIDDGFIIISSNKLCWINASTGSVTEEKAITGDSYHIIACSSKNDIYTDGADSVFCTNEGSSKFSYTSNQLSGARGVDNDFAGNIYICGHTSKNIHQLTSDGKLIRIIPTSTLGIDQPWVIRFADKKNKFLLASNGSGKVIVCEFE